MFPSDTLTARTAATPGPVRSRRPRRIVFLAAALIAVSTVSLTACAPVDLLLGAAGSSGSTPGGGDDAGGRSGDDDSSTTDRHDDAGSESDDSSSDDSSSDGSSSDGSSSDGSTGDDSRGGTDDGSGHGDEGDGGISDASREFLDDIDSAVAVTNAFWATHWSEYFTESYTEPYVMGLYDGNDPSTDPGCNGAPLGPGNAFYCPGEDFVAWDLSLMADGYVEGDSWVYLVVAHEWGHAIQSRLSDELVWQASELQAECFAGAALFGASADGTLLFESGDQKEIASGLVELGDEMPWTDSADHGDAFDRIDAFDLGRRYGVTGCLPAE